MSLLWTDLKQEIEHAKHALEDQEKEAKTESKDNNNDNDNDVPLETGWPLSHTQIEVSLRRQCWKLLENSKNNDGMNSLVHNKKNLSFEEMELHIQHVLACEPELPAAHFLRFLNCIKHGERVGAMDSLHRYFDYAIIQGNGTGGSKRESMADILEFAAILLASSHKSFGDTALAKLATEEAVRVAQQSMDASCVAFALGWIFTTSGSSSGSDAVAAALSTATTKSQAGDLLMRCATRALEGQMWSLAAGANLSKTRYHMLGASQPHRIEGFSSSLETRNNNRGFAEVAWNSLADASSHLGPDAADDGAVDRPTQVTDASSNRDVMHTLARQKLVSAGVWDYFGQTHLSGVSSFVALYCHSNQMMSHDVVNAIQNMARVSLYGSPPSALVTGEFKGKALEEIILASAGDGSNAEESSSNNVYSKALIKLISCWKQFNLPMDGEFLLSVTMVLQEWAVRRGELLRAAMFDSALQGYLHPRIHNYWQLRVDIMSLKSLLLCRQQKFAEAKELLNSLVQTARDNKLKPHHASLLLQLSLVHLDENPRQSTLALPPLLECLSMTDQEKMYGLHSTALSVLAQVQFRMRNSTRAIALLKAALPSMLQTEHVWYLGEAFLTLSKSRLQLSGFFDKQENKLTSMRLFRSVVRDLKNSQRYFEQCHDLSRLQDVFYLQARVLDKLPGEHQNRDRAAQGFLDVSQYLASADKPQPADHGYLDCLSSIAALEKLATRTLPTQVKA